jgi:hypothetical protein
MLIRVTGPNFVAGLVLDEDDMVRVAAPILKWAIDMPADTLRAELARRGFKATIVRTLTRPEITGKPARAIRPGEPIEVDDG